MAVLDTLDIRINANAMSAAKALDTLANSMRRVRSALMNTKNDVSVGDKLAKSIHELNNALTRINTDGIKKLNMLSSSLHKFASAVKSVKGMNISSSLAKSIQNVNNALNTQSGTEPQSKESEATQATGIHRLGEEFKQIKERVAEFTKQAKEGKSVFGTFFKSIGRIAL